jgi:2-polyprenyl-3-methyl-5-hydroxy-6-metoxy-1,4-benzoquinol methylase
MITTDNFLSIELEVGINPFNPAFKALCDATVTEVEKHAQFKTVFDYGCGVGAYSDAFHRKEYDITAYDHFDSHRNYVKEMLPHIPISEVPITTDLMLWIEVAEHMTDKEHETLFKTVSPKFILFSSTSETTPNDEDWGHINVKQQEDWVKLFESNGYSLKANLNVPTTWSKLFERI